MLFHSSHLYYQFVHVDPCTFLKKYLDSILQRPQVRTESFCRVLKSWICSYGAVTYPAISFFVPVPLLISPSNGRPNIRFLRVQDTPLHPPPPQIRIQPSSPGSNTNSYLSFVKETQPHTCSPKLYTLDQLSHSPARPQVETRERPLFKQNLDSKSLSRVTKVAREHGGRQAGVG